MPYKIKESYGKLYHWFEPHGPPVGFEEAHSLARQWVDERRDRPELCRAEVYDKITGKPCLCEQCRRGAR